MRQRSKIIFTNIIQKNGNCELENYRPLLLRILLFFEFSTIGDYFFILLVLHFEKRLCHFEDIFKGNLTQIIFSVNSYRNRI